jgi:hypothetical protein
MKHISTFEEFLNESTIKESVNEANSQDFTKKLPGKFYQYGSEGKKYPGKYEIEVFGYDHKKVADDLHKVLTDSKFLVKHPLFNIRVETMDGYLAVDESQNHFLKNNDLQKLNKIMFSLYDSRKINKDEYSSIQDILTNLDKL